MCRECARNSVSQLFVLSQSTRGLRVEVRTVLEVARLKKEENFLGLGTLMLWVMEILEYFSVRKLGEGWSESVYN